MATISSTLCFILILGITLANAIPEGYHATGHKVVKIKEHEKTKNIMIVKKTEVTSGGGEYGHGGGDEHGRSEGRDNGESNDKEEDEAPSPERGDSDSKGGSLSHVGGKASDGGTCIQNPKTLGSYEKFADIALSHRMFILISSKHYGNQASYVLTGKPIEENDLSKACLRVIWEGNRRRLQGWNQKSILTCNADDVKDQTCRKEENSDAVIRITYVWTDGRSHVLAINCGNGKASWAILSNKREMGKDTKDTILDIVASYGFNKDDHVEYSFSEDDCSVSIRSDIQEGPCADSDDDLQTLNSADAEKAKKVLAKGVYIPLSSLANVYGTAFFIRGTPIKPQEDLNALCVKDEWDANGEITRTGFGGMKAYLSCNIDDFQRISCVPDEKKAAEHENNYIYNKHIHPIWTDGKKYVLTYNCLSTRLKTWSLYSTTNKPLTHQTLEYILAKVADYGFDPSKAHEASYSHCKKN